MRPMTAHTPVPVAGAGGGSNAMRAMARREISTVRRHKWTAWFNNRTRLNVYLDLILTVSYIVLMEFNFTGQSIHELLGVFFGVIFGIHIVLHWQWVAGVTTKLFQKLFHVSRFKYVVNVLLFATMCTATVSGLLIAQTLGFELHLTGEGLFPWKAVHVLSSELTLLLVGLHVAISWRWIVTNTKRFVFAGLRSVFLRWPGHRIEGGSITAPRVYPTERQ